MAAAETVYEPEEPNIPKQGKPIHQNPQNPPSTESSGEGGTVAEASGTPPVSEGSDGSGGTAAGNEASKGDGGSPSAGDNGGTGQGSPAGGTPATGGQSVENAATPVQSDSDSSSPLVPILIAVAVLAAISIGFVVARQMRQRSNADGPDGSVSPKAS